MIHNEDNWIQIAEEVSRREALEYLKKVQEEEKMSKVKDLAPQTDDGVADFPDVEDLGE